MKGKKFLSMFLVLTMLFTTIPVTAAEESATGQEVSILKGVETKLTTENSEEIVYQYESEDESIAVVDQSGKIAAVNEGSCDIVTTAYYGEIEVGSKKTPVTVTKEENVTPEIPEVEPDVPDTEGMTTFVFDGSKVTVIEGVDKEYAIINKAGDEVSVAGTDDDGNSYYVAAEDDVVSVEIGKKGGSYAFEGTATDSSICVKKEASKDAMLYLNGLEMTSSYTAPIQIKKDSTAKVYIIAMEGTVNKLEDSTYNNDDNYPDNGDAENAVIKAKAGSDVTIGGKGTLVVTGNGKNGIKAATKLTIKDVNLSVTAENNAIASDTELTIESGTFQIECGNDGIKSCNDDAPIGSITIEGGDFTIDSVGDCIVATNTVTISGGEFDLTAYDGYDAEYDGDDDSYPSAKGIKASGSYIVVDETTGEETEVDFVEENQLNISGGKFAINTADDAVHSDGDLTITGGEFEIRTGDDGIHSDYVTTLGTEGTDEEIPVVEIVSCVEGIEGATVEIYSGKYELYCSDDIINAANSDLTGWSYEINIYGGTFYGSTYMGDGYDSNNNLNLYGGTHVIMSDTGLGEGNEALDCDGRLTLAGATVLTIGRSGMGVSYSSECTNAYVTFGGGGMGGMQPGRPGQTTQSSVSIANGDSVVIKDASGNILMEAVATWDEANNGRNASYVMFTSPELSKGSSVSLFVNDTQKATGTAQMPSSGWSMAASALNLVTDDVEEVLVLNVTQAEKPEIVITHQYVSEDETIVTVLENGNVKGLKLGDATVVHKVLANENVVVETVYKVHVYIELPFVDVPEEAWYYEAVEYVYDSGIMSGNGNLFTPNGDITRAQFAQVLYNMEGRPSTNDKSVFTELGDVSETAWYADAVAWAYSTGVVTGNTYTMMFYPNNNITREQLAAMMYRYSQLKGYDTTQTSELDGFVNGDKVKEYAKEAVKWAIGAGLITGSPVGTDANGNEIRDLKPQSATTRAQMAIIIQRFCEIYVI